MNISNQVSQWVFFCMLALAMFSCNQFNRNNVGVDSSMKLSLHEHWTFRADTNNATSFPAKVPGTVHTDLMRTGLIPDPYYRNNEKSLHHLESIPWVYETTFSVSKKDLSFDQIQLLFEGIDTYAEVFLNDYTLGFCYNMFRSWDFNCKSMLQEGNNTLKLVFSSPREFNQEKANALGYTLPADNEVDEIKVSPFSRKAPYHFGWDWGPRIITSGIWKPVHLHCWNVVKIKEASISLDKLEGNKAHMRAEVFVEAIDVGQTIKVECGGNQVRHTLVKGENKINVSFSIDDAKRWWPNGSGDPNLYEEDIVLRLNDQIIDQKKVKFGIRTIELVNEADSIGTSFYFKVNGKPVFIQGANYIPQDIFLPRVSDQQYRKLLFAAREASMNMIRVWGGGIYEKDIFYDLCDSLGLLVWQDFMFAGTMYPSDDVFVNNVKAEVREQVRRLKKHPSLAVFCGNNEMDVAWFNWGWQTKYNYTSVDSANIWQNHVKLFHQIIPSIVNEERSTMNYTHTSPLSNWGTAENFNHGSMHYWGVWHGRANFDSFKENVGRFVSEYGMQSYPELSTINKFATTSDLQFDSEVMINRQKSYIGNAEILKHVRQHFHDPKSFEEFVSLSQDAQAKALEIAIKAHKNSNGHCMGTMLWQLNDCWPGPSWSIIDYYGKRKKGYYVVKEEYSK